MIKQTKIDSVRRSRMKRLAALYDGAPIKRTFGMDLLYDDDGRAVFEMPYKRGFDHGLGATHGGVIATMLDNAGWFTAAVEYETWIATSNLEVRLLEPAVKADLRATGRLLRAGKNVAMAEMEVRTRDGRLVAVGSATFVVTSQSIAAAKP
jgi:acyl-CoA thioesterase